MKKDGSPVARIGAAAGTLFLLTGLMLASTSVRAVEAQRFDEPAAAVTALEAALAADGNDALTALFGDSHPEIYEGEPTVAAAERRQVLQSMRQLARIEPDGVGRVILVIGPAAWPFPLPLTQAENGWSFDAAAGLQEIQDRRIGRNELAAIRVCYDFVAAQAEYASANRDGDGVLEYAQRLLSTPSRKDGLYWTTAPGDEPSPFGEEVAAAAPYLQGRQEGEPYLGYYYYVLTRQGPNARGGGHDYRVNGNMIAGFALVAWPAEYGETGITTILCSNQGDVLETDLGEDTARLGGLIESYDPDPNWFPSPREQTRHRPTGKGRARPVRPIDASSH